MTEPTTRKVEIPHDAYLRLEKLIATAEYAVNPLYRNGISEAQAWEMTARLIALGIFLRETREATRLTALETSLKIHEPLP